MNNSNEIIELERAKFWIDDDILFCKIQNPDKNRNLNAETANMYMDVVMKLCKGKSMPFVIDLRNSKGAFLIEAAKNLASNKEFRMLSLSEAFVVNSLNIKLLISSYKRIYEPVTPYKIFENYQEALQYAFKTKQLYNGSK